MSPGDIAQLIAPAIASGQVLAVTYRHKDGSITTHQVVPYSVEAGARSKTNKPMFWSYCLNHGRIEQRIPEGVIAITPAEGTFDTQGAPAWPQNV